MKRIIPSLLLIVLCLGCIGSFAEEGKEITFMDIPWLSTPEEFNDLYYGSGRHSAEGFLKTLDRERQKQKLVKSEFAFDPEDETCPYTARSKQFEPITGKLYRLQLYSQGQKTKFLFDGQFAGLTVNFTNCYFTAVPEDPRFVMFCIFFDQEIEKKARRGTEGSIRRTCRHQKQRTMLYLARRKQYSRHTALRGKRTLPGLHRRPEAGGIH